MWLFGLVWKEPSRLTSGKIADTGVAQLAEQLIPNQQVGGSSPPARVGSGRVGSGGGRRNDHELSWRFMTQDVWE